jgi:hypothetical protein
LSAGDEVSNPRIARREPGGGEVRRAMRLASSEPIGQPPAVWSPPTFAALLCLGSAACLPAFDPDLGSNSLGGADSPLCGAQGSACCAAPAEACEADLFCDAGNQTCTRRPVVLCHGDEECGPGEVCCAAGLLGTCETGAKESCPALDLVVATPQLDADAVEWRVFDPLIDSDRCLIERGCVGGPGLRRLLGLSTIVNNVGAADLLLGSPEAPSAPTITTCGGEPRFASFLRFELLDAIGPKVQQDVAASCAAPSAGPFIAPFDCDFQGIWSGFAQPYESTATAGQQADDCRWLDITDLLPGAYTLRVTVNPDGVLPEQNLANNTPAELPLAIPAFGDATARCPDPPNPLLGYFAERECGWVRAPFQADGQATACAPGSLIQLTCTSDNAEYICGDYRLCPGADICSHQEALEPDDYGCYDFGEPNVFPSCPETGQYSLWFPSDAPAAFSCEPYVDDVFIVLTAPDAGVPVEP